MHAISSYRGNGPTHPQTHAPTHPATNKQTGPITIHCTAASAQFKYFLDSEGASYFMYFLPLSITNGKTKYTDYLETTLNL